MDNNLPEKAQNWIKELKDLQELITFGDVQKFDKSPHVEKCRMWLKDFFKGDMSLLKFSNVRDFIMISLCLDNGSRTGAIANMTIGEFTNGKYQDQTYRVHVIDHKTLDTSGPAVLSFSKDLLYEAEIYFNHFRNELDGTFTANSSKFFVSWNGNTLSSSMVTTQLNSFWGKTVGHTVEKPRFNATKVRKFAVTKVHKEKPEMKKDLAQMMCHSEKIADKVYYFQEKNKNAYKTKENKMTIVRDRKANLNLDHLTDIQIRDKVRYMSKGQLKEFLKRTILLLIFKFSKTFCEKLDRITLLIKKQFSLPYMVGKPIDTPTC